MTQNQIKLSILGFNYLSFLEFIFKYMVNKRINLWIFFIVSIYDDIIFLIAFNIRILSIMSNRLQFTADIIGKKKHVDSSLDYFGFADLLSPELNVSCLITTVTKIKGESIPLKINQTCYYSLHLNRYIPSVTHIKNETIGHFEAFLQETIRSRNLMSDSRYN